MKKKVSFKYLILPPQFIFSDIGKKSSVSENTIIFLCRKWSIFLRNSCKRDVNGRKYIPLSFQRISNWGQIYLFVICLCKGHNICCQMTQKRESNSIKYRHQTIHSSSWHNVYSYFQWTRQVLVPHGYNTTYIKEFATNIYTFWPLFSLVWVDL